MKISELFDFIFFRLNPIPKHFIYETDNAKIYKNNLMINFFKKLVFDKIFDSVVLHFCLPGHTKFSPDAIFG